MWDLRRNNEPNARKYRSEIAKFILSTTNFLSIMNTAITKGEEIKIKYIELHFIIPCCRKTTASKKNISTATQRFDLAFTKKWEAGSFSC